MARQTGPKLLRDMRKVMSGGECPDGLGPLRENYEKDPSGFLDKMTKLEQAESSRKRALVKARPVQAAPAKSTGGKVEQAVVVDGVEDVRTDRLLEVVGELLAECGREVAGEPVAG